MELVAATEQMLRADLHDRRHLAWMLKAGVPEQWPPPLTTRAALEWTLRSLESDPGQAGWMLWYWVRMQEERLLIGLGGFKGRPSDDGTIELGYSVMEEFQRQGYGSEAVGALLGLAFVQPQVRRVVADTLPERTASIRLLQKHGFIATQELAPKGILRFVRSEPPRNVRAWARQTTNRSV